MQAFFTNNKIYCIKIFILLITCHFNSRAATWTASGCPGPVIFGAFDATCPFFNGGTRLTFQPATGDKLVIPAGCTVTVNQHFTINNNITFDVYGQLKFSGSSNALDFNGCSSVINVYSGGSISASSSSNQIKICSGGAEWKGPGTDFGPFQIVNGSILLPVELIDFTSTCLSNGVQLNWSTASETDNDYFLIERSINGNDWEEIAKVKGNGTSSIVNKYIHNDNHSTNQTTYYRLSQVDLDQKKTVFKTLDVECEHKKKDEMVLFPNPSSTELNVLLNVSKESQNNIIRLMDNMGKVVFESMIDLTEGVNTFVYPIDFDPGTYHLMLSSDNVIIPSQKIMVIKP